jgi:hypothetical protein
LEKRRIKLQHHIVKKTSFQFCGACERDTIQLQSSTPGLDNDYSLFCTRCEVRKVKVVFEDWTIK